MSKQTQCPNCQAIFPMPASKLGDMGARAKCGRCQHVFLLNDNLVQPKTHTQPITNNTNPTPSDTIVSPKRTPAAPIADDMIHDDMDDEEDKETSSNTSVFSEDELDAFLKRNIVAAPIIAKSTQDEIADNDDEAWLKDLLDDSKSTPSSITTNTPNTNTTTNNSLDLDTIIPVSLQSHHTPKVKNIKPQTPTSQQIATKKSLAGRLLWGLGCLCLLGVIGVQYVIFNMNTLAKNPLYAEKLHNFCSVLNCTVPSADINAFKIDSAVKNRQGTADIIINLRNISDKEQLFPHLLMQLKNKDDIVVADFIASNEDYLPKAQTTLLSNQDKRVMLTASTDKPIRSVKVTPFYQYP